MTEATAEIVPLVSRLAAIMAAKADLEAEEKTLKAALREAYPVGEKVTVNGHPVLALQPNSRFDTTLAMTTIPQDLQQFCTVTTIDSQLAKTFLPPALYKACCKNYEPKVVLL